MDEGTIRKSLGVSAQEKFHPDRSPSDMSREELEAELTLRRNAETIHPNSYASLFFMDGRVTHKHMFAVMNPIQKFTFIFVISIFVIVGFTALWVLTG